MLCELPKPLYQAVKSALMLKFLGLVRFRSYGAIVSCKFQGMSSNILTFRISKTWRPWFGASAPMYA